MTVYGLLPFIWLAWLGIKTDKTPTTPSKDMNEWLKWHGKDLILFLAMLVNLLSIFVSLALGQFSERADYKTAIYCIILLAMLHLARNIHEIRQKINPFAGRGWSLLLGWLVLLSGSVIVFALDRL